MPIDVTLPLSLSKEDFLYAAAPPRSCQPALRFQRPQAAAAAAADHEATAPDVRPEPKKAKKQVTFADHRGLALTRVKVFSEFDDPIDIPANIREMLRAALSHTASAAAANEDKLELDFPQPSSDYLRFRQSLESELVSLERCVLKERALAGTVKVRNVAFRKRVLLRLTFDGWRSHRDVDCAYVRDAYPSADSDTFAFDVPLPERPPPRVEFAVCYLVDGREHWDSNRGNNYCVVRSSAKRSRAPDACGGGSGRHSASSDFGIHFDRYGSPTCSHGVFPDWPSYAGYENVGPYY